MPGTRQPAVFLTLQRIADLPHLATFTADITPPLGHPLCGGWIEPVRAIDDPLHALGVILLGEGRPVVLCALDWCGLRNDAYHQWREALARAVSTVPERVALHCVHQHNAPLADLEAERLLAAVIEPASSLDLEFFGRVVQRTAAATHAALRQARPFDRIGFGQALVREVASNRRVLGSDGKVRFVRTSATLSPEARAAPEGLIDPWLKTLSFWQGDRPLVALHYYATHPMSYYGDGRVSSDFCGLARQKHQDEQPQVFQVYFTGCAGNVTAGKYNDGNPANRPVLRDRIHQALTEAWRTTRTACATGWSWRVERLRLSPRGEASFGEEASWATLRDASLPKSRRHNAAFQLTWLRRVEQPIELTCLDLGQALVLHLPGEPFVEYQRYAQQLREGAFVCVAGYGDDGPGYLPTDEAFEQGGYEPTVALAAPCEGRLKQALARLLRS